MTYRSLPQSVGIREAENLAEAVKMFALLNSEATKRDVDKWTEDLLVRIELRIMHPHSVFHQNSSATEDGLEQGEMSVGRKLTR